MKRRRFLRDGGMFALGAGAAYAYGRSEMSLSDDRISVDINMSQSKEPAEKISTVKPEYQGRTKFQEITFYTDGNANILLVQDHAQALVGFTHGAHDLKEQRYADWQAPEFSGPLRVQLRQEIQNNGSYPSNEFKVGLIAPDGEILVPPPPAFEFSVPESFMPE